MSGEIKGDSVSNPASQKHLGNISAGCGEQGMKRREELSSLTADPMSCLRRTELQWEITIPNMMPVKSCHHHHHSCAPHYLALREYEPFKDAVFFYNDLLGFSFLTLRINSSKSRSSIKQGKNAFGVSPILTPQLLGASVWGTFTS